MVWHTAWMENDYEKFVALLIIRKRENYI
jgi:hypothetical protein